MKVGGLQTSAFVRILNAGNFYRLAALASIASTGSYMKIGWLRLAGLAGLF
jgi:hypothetical protein